MFDEEDRPRPKNVLQPRKLEGLSGEDLQEYLDWLAEETRRAEAALAAKGGMAAAAEALFRR